MMENEKLQYPIKEKQFAIGNLQYILQKKVDEYNQLLIEGGEDIKKKRFILSTLLLDVRGEEAPKEFPQAILILLLAIEKKHISTDVWSESSYVTYHQGDLEICREVVIRSIKEIGKSDISNGKVFLPLSNENKEQNVADILGMIIDELQADSLQEMEYDELLGDFAKFLEQWRKLDVPKTYAEEAYGIIYEIIEMCCKHKAYHTALRLSALLYSSDRTKTLANLSNTMYVLGKVVYELGYMEVAKNCFEVAEEESKGLCWKDGDEGYKELLQQETKLELTEEILEIQREIDERVNRGEIKFYTEDELLNYYMGEFEIPFLDIRKIEKDRKKLGDKAIKTYEKSANATPEERLQAIDAAFAVFTEAPEVYPEAAYLYFKKGNIYLDKGDFETAYDCFKKAYNCKDGKRNGMVLLGLAIVLSQMGRMKESTTYLFRTYILCGKDFVIDKVGEEPWKMVEAYLQDK